MATATLTHQAKKTMKKSKRKKPSLPRVMWTIKPVTRVKGSAKAYNRNREKSRLRKEGMM